MLWVSIEYYQRRKKWATVVWTLRLCAITRYICPRQRGKRVFCRAQCRQRNLYLRGGCNCFLGEISEFRELGWRTQRMAAQSNTVLCRIERNHGGFNFGIRRQAYRTTGECWHLPRMIKFGDGWRWKVGNEWALAPHFNLYSTFLCRTDSPPELRHVLPMWTILLFRGFQARWLAYTCHCRTWQSVGSLRTLTSL